MPPIPNYLEKLDNKIRVVGASKFLKESHLKSGYSFREATQLLNLKKNYYRDHMATESNLSINFLKLFSNRIDSGIFETIYLSDKIVLTAGSKKVLIPKAIDSKLAYFIGYLQGDGCLTSDKKVIIFCDEYVEQMEHIDGLSKELFNVSGKIRKEKSTLSDKIIPSLYIRSFVLNSFIHTVFGINRGIKENLKIPLLIKNNKELLKPYLAGLFDADGTLPKEPGEAKQLFIDFSSKDKEFIDEIKEALSLFGIETLRAYERKSRSPFSDRLCITYEIRIRKKGMLLKFLQAINFYHPNKAVRAKKMIKLLDR